MTAQTITATIPMGSALSNEVSIPGIVLGFGIPAGWTSDDVDNPAPISFQVAYGTGPLGELRRDGNPYAVNVAPSSFSAENKNYWGAVSKIVVRSGTQDNPVDQAQSVAVTISYDDGL